MLGFFGYLPAMLAVLTLAAVCSVNFPGSDLDNVFHPCSEEIKESYFLSISSLGGRSSVGNLS